MSLRKSSSGSWQRLAGSRRLLFFCLLLFVLSAAVSFWAFFPAQVVQRRLVQEASRQSGLQMTSNHASLLFPLGIELDLKIFPKIPQLAPITLQDFRISPVWTSLIGESRAITVQGELAGGNFKGEADQTGRVELEFNNIAVAQLQRESLPYPVTGQLQGRLIGERLSSRSAGKGEFRARLSGGNVKGLENFGLGENFSLGTLEVEGKFSQQRLSLEKVAMLDGLLDMSGGGTLQVGETPQKTRLNLSIRLQPNQSTPAALKDMLGLTGVKPAADGSYLLRIGGTLARPILH